MDLNELLEDLEVTTKSELSSMPEVVDVGDDLDVSKLPIVVRKWTRLSEVVAVVADLKGSTTMGTGKRAASTASIYEAGTGGIVKIFDKFAADFIQIQGDGAVALYWGQSCYERAMCAGITAKTMSVHLAEEIEKKWPDGPKTGFKVGVASGRVLVKRVGTPRNPSQQEPVWAGKPVNYATKAAQCADRHELVATGSVWDHIERNDYLTMSCTCGDGPMDSIWKDFEINKLNEGDPERQGRRLLSSWCVAHGEEYCNAILDGQKNRPEVNGLREAMLRDQMGHAIRAKARRERDDRRNRLKGLSA
jgi:class 3 adenylate cyclase